MIFLHFFLFCNIDTCKLFIQSQLDWNLFVHAKCQVGSNPIINCEPSTSVWLALQE